MTESLIDAHALIGAALRKRHENGGRHLHHSACIHNLSPEEQVELRGRTVDWWRQMVGPLPEQITPDDWETEPPTPPGAVSTTTQPKEQP